MKARILATTLACLVLSAWPAWANVGFSVIAAPDPPGSDVQIGVWYPTDAPETEQDLELFTQEVASDAPVSGRGHGLIVISHGTGGSMANHYDTAIALARAGFVVAAVTHTGDNWRDKSRTMLVAERPRAIRAMIDAMLMRWAGHETIEPSKIGVFGFSLGGFAALVSIGAIPDLTLVSAHCDGHPDTFTCRLVKEHEGESGGPGGPWIADGRIKAAVIAAPALGFTFTKASLAGIKVPVQLWQAANDHILPAPDYVEPVRAGLSAGTDFHLIQGADHFDFLAPCSDALAASVPDICAEAAGFDRAAFHEQFDRAVVDFFIRSLDKPARSPD